PGEVSYGEAGLLGVFQPAGGPVEGAQVRDRGVDVPPTVGIHADLAARPERVADGGDPVELLLERLPRFGDLDLRGPAPARGVHEFGGAHWAHGGDRDVDGHALSARGGPPQVSGFPGGAQPRGGLGVVVIPERGEFPDPRLTAKEHPIAGVQSAETGAQGDGVGVDHTAILGRARSPGPAAVRGPAHYTPGARSAHRPRIWGPFAAIVHAVGTQPARAPPRGSPMR